MVGENMDKITPSYIRTLLPWKKYTPNFLCKIRSCYLSLKDTNIGVMASQQRQCTHTIGLRTVYPYIICEVLQQYTWLTMLKRFLAILGERFDALFPYFAFIACS